MATYSWTGAVDSTASTAGNWSPSGPPGAGDIAQMDGGVTCNWDIASVGTIKCKSSAGYSGTLHFTTNVALNALSFDFIIATNGSAKVLTFTGTTTLSSGRYVDITSSANFANATERDRLTFTYGAGSNEKFDDGSYPHVSLTAGTFSPQYSTPTQTTIAEAQMLSLTVANAVGFAPTSAAPTANDRLKVFRIENATSGFVINDDTFNGGQAKWVLQGGAAASPLFVPVTGDTDHHGGSQTTFTSTIKHLVIDSTKTGAGAHMRIQEGLVLSVESLEVTAGACLSGEGNGCTIICNKRPKIDGCWSFKEVSPGIYMHDRKLLFGPPSGGTGLTTVPSGGLLVGDTHDKMTTLAIGSAGQVLKVNSGATALEWGTDATGGGGGGGSMSSFTLAGASGANQSITDGNTVTLAQGTGITTVGSATDTVTITNTGVTSNVAGQGIGVSGATGAVTISSTNTFQAGPGAPQFAATPDDNTPTALLPAGWIQIVIGGTTYSVPAWVNA
mgnify:CR=1 FL=1